jgi:hypothetical protein
MGEMRGGLSVSSLSGSSVMIHQPNFIFPLRQAQAPLPHQQPQHIPHTKPQPVIMSHTSHRLRKACLPSTTRQPSTPLSLMTTSWKTLNQEQLALETWTCKDPMCRTPHQQGSPTDYHSIPNTPTSWDLKPCPTQNSPPGGATIHMPQPHMAVSLRQQDTPALSPRHHPTPPRYVAVFRPKASTPQSHVKLPQKTFPMWRRHMARQQLAVDAAHALLLGVSSPSHPLSPKCQSPVQKPSDPRTPDRVVEDTRTDHHPA